MQIAQTSLAQAIAPEPAGPPTWEQHGFEVALKAEENRSQAPPGKEPPPKASPPSNDAKGGEVAKPEPNARSQKPDSQPTEALGKGSPYVLDVGRPANQGTDANDVSSFAAATLFSSSVGTFVTAQPQLPTSSQQAVRAESPQAATGSSPDLAVVKPSVESLIDPQTVVQGAPIVVPEPKGTQEPSNASHAVKNQPKGMAVGIDNRIERELGVKDVSVKPDTGPQNVKVQPVVKTPSTEPGVAESKPWVQEPYGRNIGEMPVTGNNGADSEPVTTVEPQGQSHFQNDQFGPGNSPDNKGANGKADPKIDVVKNESPVFWTGGSISKQEAGKVANPASPAMSSEQTTLVVRQAADRIALLTLARSKEAVTIHLSPPDLGDLTIVVRATGGKVDADITASNDAVKQALQQHAGQLGHSLAQRGLELNSVSVGSQGNFSTQGDSTAKQHAHANNHHNSNSNPLVREEFTLKNQPALQSSSSGVDLKI